MARMERQGISPMMVGGEGGSTFVNGDELKQADVPVETLLGAANGAVSGALVSSIASAVATVGKEGGVTRGIGNTVFRNITGNHLIAVIGGTAAFAALGAVVRNSRARKHNEWADRHYAYLEQQAGASHTDRETVRRDDGQVAAQTR